MSLAGRVALVTGGAGHIGLAMAEALAELGCQLCLLDHREEALARAKGHLSNDLGARVECLNVNLESEAERARIGSAMEGLFGRTDILINCAAFVGDSSLDGWSTSFEQQSLESWRRALEVNLTSVFHLCRLMAPVLRANGNGSIVNVGSIYGVVGPDLSLYEGTSMGNPAAYAATKGGLVQMTRWLATVLAPEIRVNCISPGGVRRNQPSEFVARYSARTPLRRMGCEEDFKGAAAYLASDLSRYVTGENLMVDGGFSSW
jgi:NAD(P)-dependent dehydrogenase (short-subunit alcohol dehydrogenase family)